MMHHGNIMPLSNCCGPQIQPVVCPPQYRCHDTFVPREVPFIHPIVNVNRVNTVVIPRHYTVETTRNVPGATIPARPGFGPGVGGFGPGVGGFGPGVGGFGPGVGGFGPGYGPGFVGPGRRRF